MQGSGLQHTCVVHDDPLKPHPYNTLIIRHIIKLIKVALGLSMSQ